MIALRLDYFEIMKELKIYVTKNCIAMVRSNELRYINDDDKNEAVIVEYC